MGSSLSSTYLLGVLLFLARDLNGWETVLHRVAARSLFLVFPAKSTHGTQNVTDCSTRCNSSGSRSLSRWVVPLNAMQSAAS